MPNSDTRDNFFFCTSHPCSVCDWFPRRYQCCCGTESQSVPGNYQDVFHQGKITVSRPPVLSVDWFPRGYQCCCGTESQPVPGNYQDVFHQGKITVSRQPVLSVDWFPEDINAAIAQRASQYLETIKMSSIEVGIYPKP